MRNNPDWLGYRRLILKSDQEPAIKSLKAATIRERPEEVKEDKDILTEEAPVGESQSNGYIERMIKTVQGMIRTMRGALEARIGMIRDSTSDITPWLVKHAAHSLGRYSKGTDGRTPHARLRGRNYNKTVCELGERVRYLIPQTLHQQLHGQGKHEDQVGVWCMAGNHPRNSRGDHWHNQRSAESKTYEKTGQIII